MKIPTRCAMCRKPLLVTVGEEYDIANDPKKLLPITHCNRCYNYRARKSWIENRVKKACLDICFVDPATIPAQDKEKLRRALGQLLVNYSALMSEYFQTPDAYSDSTLVDRLLEKPQDWPERLREVRRAYSSTHRDENPATSLPYAN